MSNPCLILEWSECHEWPGLFSGVASGRAGQPEPLRIPTIRHPAMLQPDRETAEAEAKRLAERHPGKRFAVFEASVEARSTEVPSHITVSGAVWATRRVSVLVDIDDSEVPF